jgi:hypothetical protein
VSSYRKYLLYQYVENNLGPKYYKENDIEERKVHNSHPNIIKIPVSIEK